MKSKSDDVSQNLGIVIYFSFTYMNMTFQMILSQMGFGTKTCKEVVVEVEDIPD